MKIIKVDNPKRKSQICESVLRTLPEWFAIESVILEYAKEVQSMETWAIVGSDPVGFISIKNHNPQTAEIHVMGLLPAYHRNKFGSRLIQTVEESLLAEGYEFLTVKTRSQKKIDENYDKTRRFYLENGFTPIEEFDSLWGKHNPCLMLIKNISPQSYAVIFTSKRNAEYQVEYERVAQKMVEFAKEQNGFIKVESVRNGEGIGITVSYWKTKNDIKNWKAHAEHLIAQELGRSKWYEWFTTEICRVEREFRFSKSISRII